MRSAILLLTLAGCVAPNLAKDPRILPDRYDGALPVADAYPDEFEAAMTAWREQHGEPLGCDPGRVETVTMPEEPRCERPGGCLMIHYSLLLDERYTVVVLDGADAGSVVERELAVWLARCDESGSDA